MIRSYLSVEASVVGKRYTSVPGSQKTMLARSGPRGPTTTSAARKA